MNRSEYSYFTHLHVHSQFSLLEGTASVRQLVARAKADGLSALALTDSHALYGAVAFCEACTAVSIAPIVGMSVRITSPVHDTIPLDGYGQLLLLATGPEGYRSLCGLASRLQSGSRRRVAHWQLLKPHTSGVVAIDAGHGGWATRYVKSGQPQAALRYASFLGGLYEENACLGVTLNHEADRALLEAVSGVGARFGIPPLALHPVYTLNEEDAPRIRLLTAIAENCLITDVPEERMPTCYYATHHWLPPGDIKRRFAAFPQALAQVERIVQRCDPPLPDGRPIWPRLAFSGAESETERLTRQAEEGMHDKYGASPNPEVKLRLKKELRIICNAGFAPLFLLVAQITQFARNKAVPFNTRGSVANSLVAFCLGISNVDPVAHDLLFERFLNPERINMPDIDLDFCSRRRDEVLDFVRRTFGEERVALVATVSTLQPKSAVRETGKAYGLPEPDIKRLSALLPRGWHPDPRRRDQKTLEDVISRAETALQKTVLSEAFDLIGQPHHLSIHPGGVVISPGPMTAVVPVQMAPKGYLITQYDYHDIEKIGLPKIDLLGIRALTVLADAAELLDPPLDLTQIPLIDEKTAEMLKTGDTIGVFQCESSGAQRTLRQLNAQTVADLVIANAFFKPGPTMGGMAQAFVRRYRGEEPVAYLHKALEPILKRTQGVLLFQEQVLRVATEIAGLSWSEADHLRRGISKFKAGEMAQMKQRFLGGCRSRAEFSAADAETLWEQVMAFAGYGFNQGHATAYADISYRSAYLKANYPAQFLASRLKDRGGFYHPAIYIAEVQRLGIPVMPPHVNVSNRKFTLSKIGDWRFETVFNPQSLIANHQTPTQYPQFSLWMGLGQVRDLRRETVRAIEENRPYTSLNDLLHRVPMRNKECRHLIQCGALDGLGPSRAALLAQLDTVMRAGSVGQLAFGFAVESAVAAESLPQRLAWENDVLGMPVSSNPIQTVADQTVEDVPLAYVQTKRNLRMTIAGTRLPGWTGGRGFYFGDGRTFLLAQLPQGVKRPDAWQPLRLSGFWRTDEWGGGWFQTVSSKPLKEKDVSS